MSDIRTLLHEAAGLAEPTVASIADADLIRARRALRRRRATRISAGSGLIAAAAVGALAIVGPGGSPNAPSTDTTVAVPQGEATGVRLVAYTGAQPEGFVLDKVPAGWKIRESTAGTLILAPKGSVEKEMTEGATSFEGTIAVMTQSDTGVPTGVQLDDVQVGDRPGVVAHMEGPGDTRTLFVKQSSGAYLTIQVWDGLGWDNDRIAEFGTSVHITKDAQPSVG